MRNLVLTIFILLSYTILAQDDTSTYVIKDTLPKIIHPDEFLSPSEIPDKQLIIRQDVSTQQIEDILNMGFIRDRVIHQKRMFELIRAQRPDTFFLKELYLPYFNKKIKVNHLGPSHYLYIDLKNTNYYYNLNIRIFETSNQSSRYLNYLKHPGSSIHTSKSFLFRSAYDWFFPVIIISIIILASVKLLYSKYLNQIMIAIYNYRLSYGIYNDKTSLLQRTSILLELLFYINLALFLTQVFIYYSFNPFNISSIGYFLGFLAVIPLYYYIKSGIHLLAGSVFNIPDIIKEYLSNINLVNRNLGIYLLPIVIIFPYLNELLIPILIWTGIFIMFLTFLIKIWNSLQIIFQKDISILYLILYLCTLEILPVFWIIKFIFSFI